MVYILYAVLRRMDKFVKTTWGSFGDGDTDCLTAYYIFVLPVHFQSFSHMPPRDKN